MFILDRIVNDVAVIETIDENCKTIFINTDAALISPDVREGDIILWNGSFYIADKEATSAKKSIIYKRLKNFVNKKYPE